MRQGYRSIGLMIALWSPFDSPETRMLYVMNAPANSYFMIEDTIAPASR